MKRRRQKHFTLAHLFDECFLYDADWKTTGEARRTGKLRYGPSRKPLRHAGAAPPGVDEDGANRNATTQNRPAPCVAQSAGRQRLRRARQSCRCSSTSLLRWRMITASVLISIPRTSPILV